MQGTTGGPDERLVAAHEALRSQGDIQMSMHKAAGPPRPPQWLETFFNWLGNIFEPVGRFFRWIDSLLPDWPFARIFFWTIIAALALAFLWIAIDRLRHGEWRLPRIRRRTVAPVVEEDEDYWRPDAEPVRAWLQEADALAEKGRFAEAAHHLLLRSVEDLTHRRPQIVRPALTSRDLARAEGIPGTARQLFSQIAAVVERSLFGGRSVGADDWTQCRAAYADFAQPGSWRG